MYYIKELCVKLVTYQKLHRDAWSAKYIKIKYTKYLLSNKHRFFYCYRLLLSKNLSNY